MEHELLSPCRREAYDPETDALKRNMHFEKENLLHRKNHRPARKWQNQHSPAP